MRCLVYSVLAIVSIFIVSGNPGLRPVTETARPVTAGSSFSAQCRAAAERESCWNIFEDAVHVKEYRGLSHAFQHYCRQIPPFIPCLQANKEDYRLLAQCGDSNFVQLILEQVWTFDELWDMAMDLMDATNNLVCSRQDEVVGMVECIKGKDPAFQTLVESCGRRHVYPLFAFYMEDGRIEEGIDLSLLCGVMYGYNSCMRDGISNICQGSSDLLEAFYNDIVVGVVGTSAGCEAEQNPVLGFIRSLRDEWRR